MLACLRLCRHNCVLVVGAPEHVCEVSFAVVVHSSNQSFRGASGVCGGMDPKPDHLEASGVIWVGGRWPEFDAWVREKPELVIMNCMHQKFAGPNNLLATCQQLGEGGWQRLVAAPSRSFLALRTGNRSAASCSDPLYAWVAPDGRVCEFMSGLARVDE